ncbi:MAG: terminase family protein [Nitrososphaerales archaeon]
MAEFLRNRFTIFKKVRQSGISTIAGGFALWYAMFFPEKTILIVSKRDLDAMDFLRKNIKVIHDNLPEWMQKLWPRIVDNEHEVAFPNGSRIKSLTSSRDTLRSQASSLNIIDEAAFIPDMDQMWAAGLPSISHGGTVIVISTTKGVGNWYWQMWTDAESGLNDFRPITINWWDMDWELEFVDELSGEKKVIAPTRGIRRCVDPLEIEKYGPYWSPWLEEQYKQLTQKGDSTKFRQEILAEFIGTGNTVVGRSALQVVQDTVRESNENPESKYKTVDIVDYVNPYAGERAQLDFENKLWVWKTPVSGTKDDNSNDTQEQQPHVYVMGVDTATGDASDFSTIEVLDVTTQEQVAELQIRTLPKIFAMMVDYIGRWYNNALAVIERTGIGVAICQELSDNLMYQNLYRRPKKNIYNKSNKYGDVGFNTSVSSKPILNKAIIDNTGEDGFTIRSPRLYKELSIYVHLKGGRTGAEPGKGNNDDLVMAYALALIGINQAVSRDTVALAPVRSIELRPELHNPASVLNRLQEYVASDNRGLLMPISSSADISRPLTIKEELYKFSTQIGAMPMINGNQSPIVPRKHIIRVNKK